MPTDDELLELVELLRTSLAAPTEGPSDERVAALREAVAARAEATPDVVAPVVRLNAHRRRWLAPVAIGAAAALLVVAFLVGRQVGGSDPASQVATGVVEFDGTLATPGAGRGRASVKVDKIGVGRVITFDTRALPILAKGSYYELWFVSPKDSPGSPARVSAGTFHPDKSGRSRVTFAAAVDPTVFPILSVTAEVGDGNPAATGLEVLRATIPS